MIPVLHGVWAAAGGLVGDFEHIETQTVGAGGAASITFSSIPSTYKHLQIRGIIRTASTGSGLYVRLNGDTASNYSWHALYADGAGAASFASSNAAFMNQFGLIIGTDTAQYAPFVIDLLDYTSTSKNKTVRTLSGLDRNGSGEIGLYSGLWRSTTAVTSIVVYGSGSNLAQYTTFSLYGVK